MILLNPSFYPIGGRIWDSLKSLWKWYAKKSLKIDPKKYGIIAGIGENRKDERKLSLRQTNIIVNH